MHVNDMTDLRRGLTILKNDGSRWNLAQSRVRRKLICGFGGQIGKELPQQAIALAEERGDIGARLRCFIQMVTLVGALRRTSDRNQDQNCP